ncbi:BTB/POZ and MATH domain-containing protein 2 [Rhynchospora pubera]|uniref:BTB/POZ and MATH domain-containing protein 2 n=1 Tax=Rhynchospora pubera TaxID=906938 RepID=A0AAV8HCF4_9POAL|nr:BTB/POZ and MATH domain-containing protein 2 [Rhynchospora pubera]
MSFDKPKIVADFVSVGVTATHQFKISYSKTKILPAGRSICSPTFSVAGYNCNILYYPQGLVSDPNSMCLILVLDCKSAVAVSFAYSFLDKTSRPSSKASDWTTFKFSPKCTKFGIKDIIKRSDLEAEFVKDDYFTLVFSLTITSDSPKEVPKQFVNGIFPFSINEHFTELLENKEMADVTFDVNGEIFTAHRLVLSARSPVFKAEFFGRMSESKLKCIQIKNIKPEIFKAMLHFIYSDSLPHMSDKMSQL